MNLRSFCQRSQIECVKFLMQNSLKKSELNWLISWMSVLKVISNSSYHNSDQLPICYQRQQLIPTLRWSRRLQLSQVHCAANSKTLQEITWNQLSKALPQTFHINILKLEKSLFVDLKMFWLPEVPSPSFKIPWDNWSTQWMTDHKMSDLLFMKFYVIGWQTWRFSHWEQ